MRVMTFGATGTIGRHVVEQALEQGHTVTAFTRNPASVRTQHTRLRVAQGDVMNPREVATAVAGHDAVVVTLGGGRAGDVRAPGTQAIIEGMQSADVRRLIVLSSLGAGDSRGNLNFFWKRIMFGLLLRAAYADQQRQEQHVRASELDWTIVRPSAFTDGPRTGSYLRGFGPDEKPPQLKISRADVAHFVVEQLTDAGNLHRTPAICY